MICYTLVCEAGHRFDGWFRNSATFDDLAAKGAITCAVCGTTAVRKAPMAPAVARSDRGAPPATPPVEAPANPAVPAPADGPSPSPGPSPGPGAGRVRGVRGRDLAALRAKIAAMSDDVGRSFAEEARAIHQGEAPARPIIGEATGAEAKALVEDDIPVVPMPWWNKHDA
ncbi:MAG: DUF1178 family protein [Pseudomonadota bacterium]